MPNSPIKVGEQKSITDIDGAMQGMPEYHQPSRIICHQKAVTCTYKRC